MPLLAFNDPHLSKGSSDLKQKGTHPLTQFYGTVFHAIPPGVTCFDLTVSSRDKGQNDDSQSKF